MLRFERRVVEGLTTTADPARRRAIVEYVDGALHDMPEHLRAGVLAESVLLGALPALQIALGSRDGVSDADVARWDRSRIGVIRQYARMFGSLVLFAEQEIPTT